MIQYGNIQKALGIDIAVSPKMARAIYRWSKMYVNEAPWLNEEVWSLNLPAAICSEMARLVTMESKISITGSDRADIISKSMGHFFTELSNYTEYACSVGGIVFKPYLSNKGIEIDTVKAGDFFPVEFDSAGDITAVIFPEYKRKGKELYTRLEYQALKGDTYIIANKAYVSRKANVKTDDIINLGQEISLESVEEWKELEPYVELHNADRTLFSYFKIPLANNIDTSSPLGVSVYSRSVHQIRDADEQYGATLWEYKSKETAIQAADEFFRKNRRGEVILPKGRERLYRAMGPGIMDSKGGPFFNAYSATIELLVSILTEICGNFCLIYSSSGIILVICVCEEISSAFGRVLSAPTSITFAPSSIILSTCALAILISKNSLPSENESSVRFIIPIILVSECFLYKNIWLISSFEILCKQSFSGCFLSFFDTSII